MFGYVKPYVPELKVKELERFKACYCGICRVLKANYGFVAPFLLNYEFVFLSMLLYNGTNPPDYEIKVCPYCPVRKKCVCSDSPVLDISSGMSMVLAHWKLRDNANDGGLFKRFGALFLTRLYGRAYKKARKSFPDFDVSVGNALSELTEMEINSERSLDKAADAFARLLSSAADAIQSDFERRVKKQMLYHIGRIIYISDAFNDVNEDACQGNYNPITAHFELNSAEIPENVKAHVRLTMIDSLQMVYSAYELLSKTYWSCIIENIIYFGIPDMIDRVIDGTYTTKRQSIKKLTKGYRYE